MKNNAKRQLILEVAVKIMAEKGKDASISEIARSAGVNDSLIYRYFKNKEDLMFHVAGGYIIEGIDIYLRHVEGIREPVSRLSKYIWRHLQFHDENLNYAKFAIFECRSRKSFFDHETFGHFIEWAQLLKKILEDGVRDGSFSSNLPPLPLPAMRYSDCSILKTSISLQATRRVQRKTLRVSFKQSCIW